MALPANPLLPSRGGPPPSRWLLASGLLCAAACLVLAVSLGTRARAPAPAEDLERRSLWFWSTAGLGAHPRGRQVPPAAMRAGAAGPRAIWGRDWGRLLFNQVQGWRPAGMALEGETPRQTVPIADDDNEHLGMCKTCEFVVDQVQSQEDIYTKLRNLCSNTFNAPSADFAVCREVVNQITSPAGQESMYLFREWGCGVLAEEKIVTPCPSRIVCKWFSAPHPKYYWCTDEDDE